MYLAVAVVWTWPVALQATTHVAVPEASVEGPDVDRYLAISAAGRHPEALLAGEPSRWIDQAICHPLAQSGALGEHTIEHGLLATPAYWLSGEPVLAYNAACLSLLLIAGLTTFSLVRHWTGSAWAAFFAGLLFAFHPSRLDQLEHPYVVGIHWMPLVLLQFERLLDTGRVRNAVGLALAAALQTLVGSYPMMILGFFGACFGLVRLVQRRTELDARRLALLTAAVALVGATAWSVLAPYAAFGALWVPYGQVLMLLVPYERFLPGSSFFPGVLGLLLAAVAWGIGPRWKSPLLPVTAGLLACFVFSARGAPWPGGGDLQGVYPWLAERIAFLGLVRGPAWLASGFYLGVSLLAGLGLATAMKRLELRAVSRAAVCAGFSVALLIEVFQPDVARGVYGIEMEMVPVQRKPDADVLAAYGVFDELHYGGPILDLPFDWRVGTATTQARYVLAAAYHGRPAAACVNSYLPPTMMSVTRMASRLPQKRGIDELAAAGLRNLVLHRVPGESWDQLDGASVIHLGDSVRSYRISAKVKTHSSPERLRLVSAVLRDALEGSPGPAIDVGIQNTGKNVWVLPPPIEPEVVRLRCGPEEEWSERRLLLPLALSAGRIDRVNLVADRIVPEDRRCDLELELPELGWKLEPPQTQDTRAFEAPSGPALETSSLDEPCNIRPPA